MSRSKYIIYFDECYDQPNKDFTILGALFKNKASKLDKELCASKIRHGYIDPNGCCKELKYTYCGLNKCVKVARDIVDCFIKDPYSRFACIVIEKSLINVRRFGKSYEPEKIVNARIYKKFAELLLRHNIGKIVDAVLFADKMTRCQGDRFLELLKELFSTPGDFYSKGKAAPIIKHIQEVPSDSAPYGALQICDLFCGCVLNENVPIAKKKNGKNRIRGYLCQKLGVADLSRTTWGVGGKIPASKRKKFNVWYWEP